MPKLNLDNLQCEKVLKEAEVGYLAMCRENQPYCLPFNFAHRDGKIYIHTGLKGTKWQFLKENSRVCFTAVTHMRKRSGEGPCQYTYDFESVIAFGVAQIMDDPEEIGAALNLIVDKYKESDLPEIPEDKFAKVCMIRIEINELKGKKNF